MMQIESIGGANFLNGVKNPSNSGVHSSTSSYLDTGNRNDRHKNLNPKLIPLVGCHNGDAAKLLSKSKFHGFEFYNALNLLS